MGGESPINHIEMALPPGWQRRTQTGSKDGETFEPIAGKRDCTFDPAKDNRAGVSFNRLETRYVRLTFTGNTGWPAAQLAELRVIAA